ncbi:MAG: hypothetical protein ACM31O_03885 [Bacteroidota bacterium]
MPDIPAEQWLVELFQSEWCAECGRDHRHHTAVSFMGNWFAFCDKDPVLDEHDNLIVNPEGYEPA